MVPISTNERHIFAFLVFEAHLPTVEKLWSGVNICKPFVLVWSFEFSADHVLETVVRDDMVMCTLVLDRDSFLHQTSLFELITVDERPAEAPLLIRSEALREIGIHFVR
jgi:hypothetical protein